jgi:hypothetical protein
MKYRLLYILHTNTSDVTTHHRGFYLIYRLDLGGLHYYL